MSFTKCRVLSRRLKSGGQVRSHTAVKRKRDIPGVNFKVRITTEHRTKQIRILGGHRKQRILVAEKVNLFDPLTKSFVQSKLISVLENQADRNYVQRNILNKGAIVQTEHGRARILSRPGQTGSITAIKLD